MPFILIIFKINMYLQRIRKSEKVDHKSLDILQNFDSFKKDKMSKVFSDTHYENFASNFKYFFFRFLPFPRLTLTSIHSNFL